MASESCSFLRAEVRLMNTTRTYPRGATIALLLLAPLNAPQAADPPAQKLDELYAWFPQATAADGGDGLLTKVQAHQAKEELPSLGDYQHAVRTETWTEKWPQADGTIETRTVTAELWTDAMQAALDQRNILHIPARDKPYYIDGPLVVKSHARLIADPTAEIRLQPGSNTCMVRNATLIGFPDQAVPGDTQPDVDIHIEGGIWSTLATSPKEANGNVRGSTAKVNPVFGTHGVMLLQNVRHVRLRNLTVRQSVPFAVHLANARDFIVENITLDAHRRDGVHVNGPANGGVIRGVRGDALDDFVALNAWEWANYAPSYGPIERMLIEHVTGAPEGVPAANAIRLLPGVKRFANDTELDCPITDVTLRDMVDIVEYKLYDQPNLELGRDSDFSVRIGTLARIRFEDLVFNRPGRIEVHANADGVAVENVQLNHALMPDWYLLAIGPKSQTYKHGGEGSPEHWTEIFSPDLDCTVRNVTVNGVRARDIPGELSAEQVVRVIKQTPNPDYPRTTPRGGTGRGIWSR